MVAENGTDTAELDEFKLPNGTTRFLFERNRPTLAPSTALIARGDKLASEGKYDDALGFYRHAARADPYDPHPHYQAGITLLLLQRYPEAIEEYERTCELAPGWFNVSSDLWIAQELVAGRIGHDAFLVIWAVENTGMPPDQKLGLIEQALVRYPSLAHLHFHRGTVMLALGRKADAIAAFQSAQDSDPEPGIRSRLMAQLAILSGPAEQRGLLQEIIDMPNANLMSQAMAKVMLNLKQNPS